MQNKTSINDPFDLEFCVRGLGNVLTCMWSNLYEFCYYLTFKRSMKDYQDEFKNAWKNGIDDHEFFAQSTDLYVRQCAKTLERVIRCKQELRVRWGIDEYADLENPTLLIEEKRFMPYLLIFKRSKSYKKLNLHVVRAMVEMIHCLFLYACVFTARSYKIPMVLRKQFNAGGDQRFKLLNTDDNNVDLLKNLIVALEQDLAAYTLLIENRGKAPKLSRQKAEASSKLP